MKTFLWINALIILISCGGRQESEVIQASSIKKPLHIDLSYPFLGGMPPKGQNRVIKPAINEGFEITYEDGSIEMVYTNEEGNTMVKDQQLKSLKFAYKTLPLKDFESQVTQDYLSKDSTATLLKDNCLSEAYLKEDYLFTKEQDSISIEVNRYGYTFYCFHTKSIQLRP